MVLRIHKLQVKLSNFPLFFFFPPHYLELLTKPSYIFRKYLLILYLFCLVILMAEDKDSFEKSKQSYCRQGRLYSLWLNVAKKKRFCSYIKI